MAVLFSARAPHEKRARLPAQASMKNGRGQGRQMRQACNRPEPSAGSGGADIAFCGDIAENLFETSWYPRSDSNRHALRRRILNPLRLPFRHSGKRKLGQGLIAPSPRGARWVLRFFARFARCGTNRPAGMKAAPKPRIQMRFRGRIRLCLRLRRGRAWPVARRAIGRNRCRHDSSSGSAAWPKPSGSPCRRRRAGNPRILRG